MHLPGRAVQSRLRGSTTRRGAERSSSRRRWTKVGLLRQRLLPRLPPLPLLPSPLQRRQARQRLRLARPSQGLLLGQRLGEGPLLLALLRRLARVAEAQEEGCARGWWQC